MSLCYNPQMENSLEKFLSLVPVDQFESRYATDIQGENYFGFPLEPLLKAEETLVSPSSRSIGYFSMEYGLSTNTYNAFQTKNRLPEKNLSGEHHVFSNMRAMDYYLSVQTDTRLDLPIYSGGLGVLAGDTLKSSADRGLPLVAVGILWNKGYFKQSFWFKDGQVPEENDWDPWCFPGLVPLKKYVQVRLKKETIRLRLWKYFVYSFDKKHVVPLVLLDSNVEDNSPFTRQLTGQLYRSDNAEWKAMQRIILGLGGAAALTELGYSVDTYHLNEGHAALAFVEKARKLNDAALEDLKKHFAYTCHTPVAAGHDRFPKKMLGLIVRDEDFNLLQEYGQDPHYPELINLTEFSMNVCSHVNAVAQKHGEVTRLQFPQFKNKIEAITNGVHSHTWISRPVEDLFAKYEPLKNWAKDPCSLKNAATLKDDASFRADFWEAHQSNKKRLCAKLRHWRMSPDVFTIAWARRIAAYKRPSLILQDVKRLIDIAHRIGPIQIVFAGKAHPKDDLGFTYVNEMLSTIDSLEKEVDLVRVVMLENYNTYFGKLLSSGVDVWLNNPLPPFEASGTSGMKAILNGVLQLSTLDGWVVEAADDNIGWIFGWEHHGDEVGDERDLKLKEDSSKLYDMLEQVMTLYYRTNLAVKTPVEPASGKPGARTDSEWITKMIAAVTAAGFFNTDRMVAEYSQKIWNI